MLGLSRVRELAKKEKEQTFTQLMHHVTLELLKKGFHSLKKRAAKGIDGIGWSEYEVNEEANLADLYQRIQSGRYKPKPAKRVYIPKADGSERPLSIQCIEDKIAQHTVVTVLNQIYENDFLGFSYGFRPKRSQHDALDALTYSLSRKKVSWVLDLDISKFFDSVEHAWLIRMVQHRVKDKRLVKLIERWIKVGTVEDGNKRQPAYLGIPQGAVISPLLANIYLHYVFDLWSNQWRKKVEGDVTIVRYADDAVLCFQHQSNARNYLVGLKQRLSKFGLSVHPDKTKLIRFGRFARSHLKSSGSKPQTFDFLGFTHYCAVTRNGCFKVGRKTINKRLRKQVKAVQLGLRKRMHEKISVTLEWLGRVLRGHVNYYGVPGNGKQLSLFHYEIVRRWFKMLRRRSQRHSLTWERFGPWVRARLPKVRIVHPYPEQRFCAKHSR
jgi:RNA-directed DNA polymerase